MKFDLQGVRKSYNYSTTMFAKAANLGKRFYEIYEMEGEIPCKYIYNLWKALPNFPIPEDFFFYTSLSLDVNMRYHKLRQVDIARMFHIPQQAISKMITSDPLPMYEMKELFIESFNPLITPCIVMFKKDNTTQISVMTELTCKGNFVATKKRREYKRIREKTGLSTAEHKRMRMHQNDMLLKQYVADK